MAILVVPTVYPDIVAAVAAAAAAGDTVLIEASTHTGANNKNIDPGGKDIIFTGSTDDPADTIIDCEHSGRAFYVHSGETLDLIIRNLTIYDGYPAGAKARGGGIWIDNTSKLTVNNVVIDDCRAAYGSILIDTSCELVMSNSIIRNGHNFDYAAALFFYFASGTITNCQFYNNQAGASGALYCYSSSPSFTCCLFHHNTAVNYGGAIYSRQSSYPTFYNCTITENSVTGASGENYGGGIYTSASSYATLTNCILWGNTAVGGCHDLRAIGSVTFNYCDCRSGAPYMCNTFTRNNCIEATPEFITGPSGDYCLNSEVDAGADSPCIDAGSDTAANLGIDDRTTRTDGARDSGTVDMGWHYALSFVVPTASCTASPTSATLRCKDNGIAVQFTDTSTGDVTSWLWNFGDGETSSEQNPEHTFYGSGIYVVTLTVIGPAGSDVVTITITIIDEIKNVTTHFCIPYYED
jgi:predicted outer membrane repeat protein